MEKYTYIISYSFAVNNIKKSSVHGLEIVKFLFEQVDDKHNPSLPPIENPDSFKEIINKFLREEIDAESACELLLEEVINLLEQEKDIDWKDAMGFLGKHELFAVLDRMKDFINDEAYWMLVRRCYTSSDFCYNDFDTLKGYFINNRTKREYLMDAEEQDFLSKLPDSFKVYRGCSVEEVKSGQLRYSWSLDKKIANFFAKQYKRNEGIECVVIDRVVTKKEVTAYFGSRESEILIFPKN